MFAPSFDTVKGLPPLPPKTGNALPGEPSTPSESTKMSAASDMQSRVSMGARVASKRKINPEASDPQPTKGTKPTSSGSKPPKKKAKKETKNLLSFGTD
jgi:hypothetical protein